MGLENVLHEDHFHKIRKFGEHFSKMFSMENNLEKIINFRKCSPNFFCQKNVSAKGFTDPDMMDTRRPSTTLIKGAPVVLTICSFKNIWCSLNYQWEYHQIFSKSNFFLECSGWSLFGFVVFRPLSSAYEYPRGLSDVRTAFGRFHYIGKGSLADAFGLSLWVPLCLNNL